VTPQVVFYISRAIGQAVKELSDFSRLLDSNSSDMRRLVFYSESAFHYRYLKDYIQYILDHSDLPICYITSQADDPILSDHAERIHPFYIKNSLAAAFAKLDSKAIVMTAPDLENSPIKRSPLCPQHVYAMHGVGSVHQGYRFGAFDHYDSVLCIGQFQIDELTRGEEMYKTRKKRLIMTGYPYLEQLNRDFCDYQLRHPTNGNVDAKPICLVAPTWAPVTPESSLMHEAIIPLLDALARSKFEVWLRPHPEYIKRNPQTMKKISEKMKKFSNLKVETELPSLEALFKANVLITDHSSIAFDFAFGTERPVLFINTPTRIDNPQVDKLGIAPIENQYREALGGALAITDIPNVATHLEQLLTETTHHHQKLRELRSLLIANWGDSAKIGGDYILSCC
jgi:YidC/Oxa1 family membrane protein insertase